MTVEFLAEHQLYIVMIIVVGIWLGLFAYLWRLDGRLKKLERTTENNG
ncbi:MAG: CcmD family protein [Ignavibacteriae bacterium]|nr:CcmD family protein [Ignavibacteriota bacterium]